MKTSETFKAQHIETRENSVRIGHLGKNVFLPRSQIERMHIDRGWITLTIPYWLYQEKFENE